MVMKKFSNLRCSCKSKIHLQVKQKFKVDLFTTPRQNSLAGPYHHPLGRDKLLIPCSYGGGL